MFQISALRRDDFDELFPAGRPRACRPWRKAVPRGRKPGFPCRVSLQDAEPGEQVILVPYSHQSADSPYKASGPIFVREHAQTASIPPDTIPALLRTRVLSSEGARRSSPHDRR